VRQSERVRKRPGSASATNATRHENALARVPLITKPTAVPVISPLRM